MHSDSTASHISEGEVWNTLLLKLAKAADSKFEGEVLGSYRRGAVFQSDIDLVIR